MNHKLTPKEYVALLCKEIKIRAPSIAQRDLTSLYFGGGTPSVLHTEEILAIRTAVANEGFRFSPSTEITVEINPGTVTNEKLDLYLEGGVTRFSVGVQTFNFKYLKHTGRLHSVDDSRDLLALLAHRKLNFSFDLLFGLPQQTLKDLEKDLDELLKYCPPHVSLYNLTVPKNHAMNVGRASDDEQAQMFSFIDERLTHAGLRRYEISNFSRPGFESKHNDLYWSDQPYWGIGVGAHSYIPDYKSFGARFWNPTTSEAWGAQVESLTKTPYYEALPSKQIEPLLAHESLTDFCHTSLRKLAGLELNRVTKKYGESVSAVVKSRMDRLVTQGLLAHENSSYFLTPSSYARANMVFLELTFLGRDL